MPLWRSGSALLSGDQCVYALNWHGKGPGFDHLLRFSFFYLFYIEGCKINAGPIVGIFHVARSSTITSRAHHFGSVIVSVGYCMI